MNNNLFENGATYIYIYIYKILLTFVGESKSVRVIKAPLII